MGGSRGACHGPPRGKNPARGHTIYWLVECQATSPSNLLIYSIFFFSSFFLSRAFSANFSAALKSTEINFG
ncbi:MAG: hypothetical protein CM15mP55_0220 [Hyphomicrobiales bacterium]|nr:MAG: hypothetical protein CM15mP55_0220 [Hyphomicrobiales bacterium]